MGGPWKHGETYWVLGGMAIGFMAGLFATAASHSHYWLVQPNPLMLTTVIGGIVGLAAAKIAHLKK